MKRCFLLALLLTWMTCAPAIAVDKDDFWQDDRRQLYGDELMSPEERQAYRQKMWDLKTDSERERYRSDHREQMKERARDRGIVLPENNFSDSRPAPEPIGKWPNDGLRRWPEERVRQDGLKRWPPTSADEGRAAGVRTWHPERLTD